jgi:hypothetical protein
LAVLRERRPLISGGATELNAKVLGIPIAIQCASATVAGAEIVGNGTAQGLDKASSIAFEKCAMPTPKGCVVAQPIKRWPSNRIW